MSATISPPPCDNLRAKRAYGHVVSSAEPDWRDGLLATDCFWCLATLQAWGPDDCPATAGDCAPHRSCYVPPPGMAIARATQSEHTEREHTESEHTESEHTES